MYGSVRQPRSPMNKSINQSINLEVTLNPDWFLQTELAELAELPHI